MLSENELRAFSSANPDQRDALLSESVAEMLAAAAKAQALKQQIAVMESMMQFSSTDQTERQQYSQTSQIERGTEKSGQLATMRRSYSDLISAETGLPLGIVKEALSEFGREPSAKGQVLSAAQRIMTSREPIFLNTVADEHATSEPTRSYSTLCADEAGVPLDVRKKVLTRSKPVLHSAAAQKVLQPRVPLEYLAPISPSHREYTAAEILTMLAEETKEAPISRVSHSTVHVKGTCEVCLDPVLASQQWTKSGRPGLYAHHECTRIEHNVANIQSFEELEPLSSDSCVDTAAPLPVVQVAAASNTSAVVMHAGEKPGAGTKALLTEEERQVFQIKHQLRRRESIQAMLDLAHEANEMLIKTPRSARKYLIAKCELMDNMVEAATTMNKGYLNLHSVKAGLPNEVRKGEQQRQPHTKVPRWREELTAPKATQIEETSAPLSDKQQLTLLLKRSPSRIDQADELEASMSSMRAAFREQQSLSPQYEESWGPF